MNIFTPKTSQNHSNFREITYNQTRVHRGSKSHLKTLLTSQTRTQNLNNAKTSSKDQNNLSFSVFGPKRKNVNFWAKVQIHKSIKTLCNCIKVPKVLPLEGGPVLEEKWSDVCVDL